ncbi:MAG: thioredoxin domain-containing protein [Chloroflexaceae bacterium]|nr:thioredoxin domain-containing protein [Chloroflexaceae bacterium]
MLALSKCLTALIIVRINSVQPTDARPSSTNRLIHATSPYLLQHAHNPVDWYEWGDEALAKARTEDKPILLSIGYSSCHWCHVMAHESFEDPAVAAVMNEHFVNIKVDREERPDIDSIYMAAVVAMTRRGGWPLTAFLFADGTPFYGGTYFPPDATAQRYGMTGFKSLLFAIHDAYRNRREELEQNATQLLGVLQQEHQSKLAASPLTPALLDNLFFTLIGDFDYEHGGFGGAPKFPQPTTLEMLLHLYARNGSSEVLRMLELTLTKMAHGGMYDQLGGGFHRYSVDERWLVPHFEKMLYDNGLLTAIYTQAWQITRNPLYQRIVEETLSYIEREMTSPDGGFYSAQDADTEGEEGKFFVWRANEVRDLLGEDAVLFSQIYEVTARGNFEGQTVLNVPRPLSEIARVTGVSLERLEQAQQRGRAKLWQVREQRVKPGRDEKILTAWNAMMLRGYALAAAAFANPAYLHAAQRNAAFVLDTLRRADGRLMRSWKDGRTVIPAYLEDYALLSEALLTLHGVDGDARWLNASLALADDMLRLFWDEPLGGFYDTATDQEQLITRPRDLSDNATPSGTSTAVYVLLKLATITGNHDYRQRAVGILETLVEPMQRVPNGFGRALSAVAYHLARVREIVLVGDPAQPDLHALLQAVHHAYRPFSVVVCRTPSTAATGGATAQLELLAQRDLVEGTATAYVCEGFTCQLPVSDATALQAQLDG